jgi:hypothetical protein
MESSSSSTPYSSSRPPTTTPRSSTSRTRAIATTTWLSSRLAPSLPSRSGPHSPIFHLPFLLFLISLSVFYLLLSIYLFVFNFFTCYCSSHLKQRKINSVRKDILEIKFCFLKFKIIYGVFNLKN